MVEHCCKEYQRISASKRSLHGMFIILVKMELGRELLGSTKNGWLGIKWNEYNVARTGDSQYSKRSV